MSHDIRPEDHSGPEVVIDSTGASGVVDNGHHVEVLVESNLPDVVLVGKEKGSVSLASPTLGRIMGIFGVAIQAFALEATFPVDANLTASSRNFALIDVLKKKREEKKSFKARFSKKQIKNDSHRHKFCFPQV